MGGNTHKPALFIVVLCVKSKFQIGGGARRHHEKERPPKQIPVESSLLLFIKPSDFTFRPHINGLYSHNKTQTCLF